MMWVSNIVLGMLAVAAVLMAARAIKGPTVAERIVALDVMLVVVTGGILVGAARTGNPVFLDLAVVAALLGFVGTVSVARFIERRGS
jgi:multicomponent Na+:H+ antiporter subunit F